MTRSEDDAQGENVSGADVSEATDSDDNPGKAVADRSPATAAGRPSTAKSAGAATDIERFDVAAVNTGEVPLLYKGREPIYPRRVSGTFRTLKWWIMGIALAIYYITPWLRWNRGEHAPDQAVLIDMANRRFYFFFIEIWPQEFYYVAGLLIMAGVGLFLITSTVGRAWCGYACPQTVWTDLFIWVERLVEGDRNARIKLDAAPWTFGKVRKKVTVHAVWLLIALATGGAWIFYFADAPALARDFLSLEAPPIAYATVAVLTFTTYTLGGLMREQVCTYMCPWPRIQAAMMDEYSLTVTYNDWRGEPRSRHRKKALREGIPVGDCVDCNACVAVCPTGIDIRDGQQLQCITCALCVDACNAVMEKLNLDRGLIGYSTLKDYDANKAGIPAPTTWRSFLRTRTALYFGVWSLIGLVMLGALLTRTRLDVNLLHDRNPVYVQLADGAIRNGYTLKILNMVPQPRQFAVSLHGLTGGAMWRAAEDSEPARELIVDVGPDRAESIKLLVRAEPGGMSGASEDFQFRIVEIGGRDEETVADAVFEGPGQR